MKRFFKWLLPLLVLASCNKETGSPVAPAPWRASSVRTEGAATLRQVTLGKHLDSPYLVENVRRAYEAVYPTRSGIRVEPTDLYVRFLPAGPEDLARLEETDIDLFDYPLDYEILSDGDWYHDPSLPEDRITWQYAVVPVGFAFPEGIPYEVLGKCCFPGSASLTRAAGEADWDAVEHAAFEMTGNGDLLESGTRASKTRPEGRITIVDTGTSGRKTVGVSGVKVTANTLLKTSSAYTDAKGTASSRYSVKAVINGKELASDDAVPVWGEQFLTVNLDRPAGGSDYTYSPNDIAVGDVDGDGEFELVLKWDPSNSKDNSQKGKTGNVIIDCYKMSGKKLWRIDLGVNIRAGAHYTQMLVGDYDGG